MTGVSGLQAWLARAARIAVIGGMRWSRVTEEAQYEATCVAIWPAQGEGEVVAEVGLLGGQVGDSPVQTGQLGLREEPASFSCRGTGVSAQVGDNAAAVAFQDGAGHLGDVRLARGLGGMQVLGGHCP